MHSLGRGLRGLIRIPRALLTAELIKLAKYRPCATRLTLTIIRPTHRAYADINLSFNSSLAVIRGTSRASLTAARHDTKRHATPRHAPSPLSTRAGYLGAYTIRHSHSAGLRVAVDARQYPRLTGRTSPATRPLQGPPGVNLMVCGWSAGERRG